MEEDWEWRSDRTHIKMVEAAIDVMQHDPEATA
jgi:hypothetical protein